jgi:DMSO/TMAO reductase YedYZ molybdopterin-dependent catalytic subunit
MFISQPGYRQRLRNPIVLETMMFDDKRRELEKQAIQENRLPPGQSLTIKFPVLHYGQVPRYDLRTWTFRAFGLVKEEKIWTWDEFSRLPSKAVTCDIHCVTRWSKLDTEWEGVALKDCVDAGFIQLKPTARFLLQHCEYGFTVNVPLAVALAPNFLLATHYNGQSLEPEHGYPVRGVVGYIPGTAYPTPYLWKGGKWVRGLEFMAHDRLGFWEQAGYHNEADVWTEQRFSD